MGAERDRGTPRPKPLAGGQRLFQFANRIARAESIALSRLAASLTHRQYRVLMRIHAAEGTATDLAVDSTISLAAMSETVDALHKRGLIAKNRGSVDRRTVHLRLTESGEAAYQEAHEAMEKLAAELLSGLSAPQLQDLESIFSVVDDQFFSFMRDYLND